MLVEIQPNRIATKVDRMDRVLHRRNSTELYYDAHSRHARKKRASLPPTGPR